YLPAAASRVSPQVTVNELAIIRDLNDQERTLKALTVSAVKVLANHRGEEIITICRSIFFKLMTGLLKQSSLTPGSKFYEDIVGEEFQTKGRRLENGLLPMIA